MVVIQDSSMYIVWLHTTRTPPVSYCNSGTIVIRYQHIIHYNSYYLRYQLRYVYKSGCNSYACFGMHKVIQVS